MYCSYAYYKNYIPIIKSYNIIQPYSVLDTFTISYLNNNIYVLNCKV